jgi:RNA polymerase sigma-70 factor (ECF subfamily)
MTQSATIPAALEDVFQAQRSFLWALCYRLTGSAADADDLVQETFVRAIERPPPRTDQPWRPWLVRVAVNLGRDLLRRRRRRKYVGPWLPSPIETGEGEPSPSYELTADSGFTTEGRYELLESVSFAFLLALEALTPQQRAVLLLRDVFDYSVDDTADALAISAANVKTTHHRARRAMDAYDRQRCLPTRDLQERTREVLGRFMAAITSRDVASVESLLAEDVRTLNDGGGEYLAALNPVIGSYRVARLYLGLTKKQLPGGSFEVRVLNGLPACLIEFPSARRREAPRFVVRCDIDGDGRIRELHVVLAPRKLTAVRFAQKQPRRGPSR